jgi:hypothetical protein
MDNLIGDRENLHINIEKEIEIWIYFIIIKIMKSW